MVQYRLNTGISIKFCDDSLCAPCDENSDPLSDKEGGIDMSSTRRDWDPQLNAIPTAINKKILAQYRRPMLLEHYSLLTSYFDQLMAPLIRFLSLLVFIAQNGGANQKNSRLLIDLFLTSSSQSLIVLCAAQTNLCLCSRLQSVGNQPRNLFTKDVSPIASTKLKKP